MNVWINDYAGHEFPLHLCKELSRRGSSVSHSHCASNVTPHGDFEAAAEAGVVLRPIDLGRSFEKHKIVRRAIDEIDYGVRSASQLRRLRPDHAVAAQLPVLSLVILMLAARVLRIPLTLWLQDIQSVIAQGQSKRAAQVLGFFEDYAIRHASQIITISEGMADIARSKGPRAEVVVIENWADVDKITPGERINEWATGHGLDRTTNFLYSGTLGVKHRPEALVALAEEMVAEPDARVVVVSQGAGTDTLREMVEQRELSNIVLLPLQDAKDLPNVLATGDVLLALLEEDAAAGCVPSKILAYLASGRPVLGLMPASNLASSIISDRAEAGFAVQTISAFAEAASALAGSPDLRRKMGGNARVYAEREFNISLIADRFLSAVANQPEGANHGHFS